jgi:DNA-binding CsgD family transcriptional regulator
MDVRDFAQPYYLFILFAVVVMVGTGTDLIEEYAQGEPAKQMWDDLALFLLGGVVVWRIVVDLWRQRQSIAQLESTLANVRGELAKLDTQSSALASQYGEVMQRQFERWKLTRSEQEVSVCLLKGLSFKEISAVRNTSERTVRQQAAMVYQKAGLAGRHELAAWFFEDMLSFGTRS